MPYQINEFPTIFLNELDQVLLHETYAGRYTVQGAEFINNRTVNVPEITFPNAAVNDYDRFQSENNVKLEYTPYTLSYDKEGVFYVDAVDDRDTAALLSTHTVAEYQRTVFGPYVDVQFFRFAAQKAKTKATTALTTANIKGEIRKARTQFFEAGLEGGELYVTSEVKGLLEDATQRQWGNDGSIYDVIGIYDGFSVIEVPAATLGCDFLAIAGGQSTIRHILKRAVSYLWAPGSHTNGDGWMAQLRWVFGDIVRNNRRVGIYCNSNGGLIVPEHDGSPVSDLAPLTVAAKGAATTIYGHTVSDLQTGVTVADGKISGTLKYVTEGDLPDYWGPGNFLALDFANPDEGATEHWVGLMPSKGSGIAKLDNDMDAACMVTDPQNQKLIVISSNGVSSTTTTYDLSGLVLETS